MRCAERRGAKGGRGKRTENVEKPRQNQSLKSFYELISGGVEQTALKSRRRDSSGSNASCFIYRSFFSPSISELGARCSVLGARYSVLGTRCSGCIMQDASQSGATSCLNRVAFLLLPRRAMHLIAAAGRTAQPTPAPCRQTPTGRLGRQAGCRGSVIVRVN
jgi:hypothetical protein